MQTTARSRAVANENRSIEQSQQRAIAGRQQEEPGKPRRMSALESLALRLDVSAGSLQRTLMQTAFKGCSEAEFIALVIVSNTYNLNPLLREIYAFPKKGGGIQAIVGYDGWIKIANDHPQYDGFEYDHITDADGVVYAVEGICHRKDRGHATKKIVYLKEFKRNTDPWNNAPNHMLDVRCFCQTVRLTLGVPLGVDGVDNVDAGVIEATAKTLPTRQSLAEELDDEIPAFDNGGHDPSTGEVYPTDDRGMTPVDEETARALDNNDGTLSEDNLHAGEGPADEQRGEANSDAEQQEPAYLAQVRTLRGKLTAAKTVRAVENLDMNEWCSGLRDTVDQADSKLARSIDNDIAARKRELQQPKEG